MQHDPPTRHSHLYVCFDVMALGVFVMFRIAAAENGDCSLDSQVPIPDRLVCAFGVINDGVECFDVPRGVREAAKNPLCSP